jgi:hypothetical protein
MTSQRKGMKTERKEVFGLSPGSSDSESEKLLLRVLRRNAQCEMSQLRSQEKMSQAEELLFWSTNMTMGFSTKKGLEY